MKNNRFISELQDRLAEQEQGLKARDERCVLAVGSLPSVDPLNVCGVQYQQRRHAQRKQIASTKQPPCRGERGGPSSGVTEHLVKILQYNRRKRQRPRTTAA